MICSHNFIVESANTVNPSISQSNMDGHNEPKEILKLNPEAVWISAITATKSMLCDFMKWETLPENEAGMVGDFMKRVSDWHENILGPWTLHLVLQYSSRP